MKQIDKMYNTMKQKRLKLSIALISFAVYSICGFAQERTIQVMRNGVVVFESAVSDIESIVFQDPLNPVSTSSQDVLIVHETISPAAGKTLLDNIERLIFSADNLSVIP